AALFGLGQNFNRFHVRAGLKHRRKTTSKFKRYLVSGFRGGRPIGLIAPRNALALVTITLGAVSIASAIYVIVDLDTPLTGPIMISSSPMRDALEHLMR
ncbi:hypothetical protein AB3X85_15590, partial [Paraburkholderia phenoliruptrix]